MNRGFDFLKKKYYEMLMPNLFVQMSYKVGTVVDVIVVGFLLGSSKLPSLNVLSPFLLFSSIIYSLYGHGGSLLAIKAKSDFDSEKANRYFTLSVMGCITGCLALMIGIAVFTDYFLLILNIPADIYQSSRTYLLIATGFFRFQCICAGSWIFP